MVNSMQMNRARNAFLSQIVDQIRNGEDIAIVSADLASPILDSLRQEFPERFVPVGIAEQNLIAVGSGIALSGTKVICYTSNPFLITRAYDQIRNSVSMMNIPICLVGIGAGFNVPEYGATHYVTEDIALVRTCPNIEVFNVADEKLGEQLGKNILHFDKPTYIRIDKENYAISNELDIDLGFRILNHGSRKAIISSGYLGLKLYKENEEEIRKEDILFIDVFSYQYDNMKMKAALMGVEHIVVVEENIEMGSIYETIKHYSFPSTIDGMHVNHSGGFPHYYGNREYFLQQYGLTWEKVKEILA